MIKKIIYVIITFLICMCVTNNCSVYATDQKKGTDTGTGGNPRYRSEMTQETDTGTGGRKTEFDPDYYVEQINSTESKGTDKISSIGKRIIGLLRGAGTVVSVIVLIAIGIKYMIGSVEEKATYKQTLLPYVIGAVFVFGITTILPIIIDVAKAI